MATEILYGLIGFGGWATSKFIRENRIKKSPNIRALTDVFINIVQHAPIIKGQTKTVDVEKSVKEFRNLKRIIPNVLGILSLGASAIEFIQQNPELAIGLFTFGLTHLLEVHFYRRKISK